MNVIFLDIDGVLNGGHHPQHGFDWVLPSAISELNRIIELTHSKVIVSSSWRLEHSMEELQAKFNEWGVQAEIIGVTPEISNWDDECECHFSAARIQEIRWWLDTHQNITQFAMIDDQDICQDINENVHHDADIVSKWIQTVTSTGLTQLDADKVIATFS